MNKRDNDGDYDNGDDEFIYNTNWWQTLLQTNKSLNLS